MKDRLVILLERFLAIVFSLAAIGYLVLNQIDSLDSLKGFFVSLVLAVFFIYQGFLKKNNGQSS